MWCDHHHQHVLPGPSRSSRARSGISAARSNGSAASGHQPGQLLLPGPGNRPAPSPARRRPAPAGTAARPRPGTPSAAPRAGRSHRPAPPPAPPASSSPASRTATGVVVGRPTGPPAGRGTTAAAGRTTTAPAPVAARAVSGSRAGPAWPSRTASGSRRRRLEQHPDRRPRPPAPPGPATPAAPPAANARPASKKPSSGPTRSRPSTSANIPHSSSSAHRRRGPALTAGRGVVRGGQRRPVQLPVHRQRQLSSTTTAAGTMYSGSRDAAAPAPRRQPAPGRSPSPPGTTYATSRLSPGTSSRTVTAAWRHPRVRGQHRLDLAGLDPEPADLHLIIGPPGEHQLPAGGVHRARSPVRYIRSPPAPNGHATNRSAVSPGRPSVAARQPRPGRCTAPRPPRPAPGSATRPARYTRVLATGGADRQRPAASAGWHRQSWPSTVVSVGPYVLTSRRPAARRAGQRRRSAPPRPAPASPDARPGRRVQHAPAATAARMRHRHARHRAPAPPAPPAQPARPAAATTSAAPASQRAPPDPTPTRRN